MENGIKRIRLCMGLTQQQFADMLGCSQGNVGHYELRDQMVPPEMARKLIAEAAKRGSVVTYEDIYGTVDEPVVIARFVMTRVDREINERKKRHAED
jgi:putative transcriptional regulator